MKLNEMMKALLEERNDLAVETNTEGTAILKARGEIDATHKTDCPCRKETGRPEDCTDDAYKTAMAGLADRVKEQKIKRERIVSLDETIEAGTEIAEKMFEGGEIAPVTGEGMERVQNNFVRQKERSGTIANQMGTDFHGMLQQLKLTNTEEVKSRLGSQPSSILRNGSEFRSAGSFIATFGTDNSEITSSTKSAIGDMGLGEDFETSLKTRRATKSMFTQHPLAGGDSALYAPTQVFPGNTGGLCEYMIDDALTLLPYAPTCFLNCIPVRTIPKSYVLFARQTLRVNNARSIAETAITTGNTSGVTPSGSIASTSFVNTKPESRFGFSQVKAYTLTFADTLPVSEEFLEDCPTVADAVESQLMENVRQEFYRQIINGDGHTTGANPEIIGLLAQVGLSTRIHQGAATFYNNITVTDVSPVTLANGAGDDNIRETLERAVFDAEAYGFTIDCILMNYNDYIKMHFLKDDFGKPLYTQAELDNIAGAKVCRDIRMPAGTALVGAFAQSVQLLMRRQIRLDIGWVNTQFLNDMMTLRVTMRGGLLVKAPHALIRVTGL